MSIAAPREAPKRIWKKPKQHLATAEPKKSKPLKPECLKLVLRLLPPSLDEDLFYSQLGNYTRVDEDVIVDKYYVQGAYSNTPYERPTYSRGYLLFKTRVLAEAFMADVKGKPFTETKTNDSLIPIVSNALNSNRMPHWENALAKIDGISEDPTYKEFLKFIEGTITEYNLSLIQNKLKSKKAKKSQKKQKVKKENGNGDKEIMKPTTQKAQTQKGKKGKAEANTDKDVVEKKKKPRKKKPKATAGGAVVGTTSGKPASIPSSDSDVTTGAKAGKKEDLKSKKKPKSKNPKKPKNGDQTVENSKEKPKIKEKKPKGPSIKKKNDEKQPGKDQPPSSAPSSSNKPKKILAKKGPKQATNPPSTANLI